MIATTDQVPRARIMSAHDRLLMDRAVSLSRSAAQVGIKDQAVVAALVLADAIDASMSRAVNRIGEELQAAVLQILAGKAWPREPER